MAIAANLGFPRIGARRQLKRAVEEYWAGSIDPEELAATAAALRRQNWQLQQSLGIEHVPSNDFSLYDHVLDTAVMLGAVPKRFAWSGATVDLPTYFAMARGANELPPLHIIKWFDTNYHFLVPEFEPGMKFKLASTKPVDEFREAAALGIHTRPVLLGPLTFLLLGKCKAARAETAGPSRRHPAALRRSALATGPCRGRLGANRRAGVGARSSEGSPATCSNRRAPG